MNGMKVNFVIDRSTDRSVDRSLKHFLIIISIDICAKWKSPHLSFSTDSKLTVTVNLKKLLISFFFFFSSTAFCCLYNFFFSNFFIKHSRTINKSWVGKTTEKCRGKEKEKIFATEKKYNKILIRIFLLEKKKSKIIWLLKNEKWNLNDRRNFLLYVKYVCNHFC